MKTAKRNGVIDFMRFVFSVVIVIFHSRNLGGKAYGADNVLFADAGYIAVEFFFLVSGFLMAKSALSAPDSGRGIGGETLTFLWKKIKALLPYYLFAVFFSYARIVYVNDYTAAETVRNFMAGIWDLAFLRAAGFKSFSLIRATWYLSAMFTAMMILYPMVRKWKRTFTHLIAPLIAIGLMGYLTQNYSSLDLHLNHWDTMYAGLVRGLAEISLGCVCYVICEKMKGVTYTLFSRILITLTQVLGYGFVLRCMHNMPNATRFDFVLLPILAICVVLSFSGQGVAVPLFTGKAFPWLGKVSMVVYVNHMWVKDSVAGFFPASLGYWKLLGITLGSVTVVSAVCMLFVDGMARLCNKHKETLARCFVKP